MIDFAEIERLNLRDPNGLAALDAALAEVASYSETRSAAEIVELLQRKIVNDPALSALLQSYLVRLRVLALPVLTDQQAATVFLSVADVLADERIGFYERLRARLIILPVVRRKAFADTTLASLRSSTEQLGTIGTVGSWVVKAEQLGALQDPEKLFTVPDFRKLDDESDHAMRHLVHILTLLADPDNLIAKQVQRKPVATAPAMTQPVVPPNLPVAPAPASSRVPPASPPVSAPSSAAPPQKPMPVPLSTSPVAPDVTSSFSPNASAPLTASAPSPRPSQPSIQGAVGSQPVVQAVPTAPPVISAMPTLASALAHIQSLQGGGTARPPSVAQLSADDEEEIQGHTDRLKTIDAGPNVHDMLGTEIASIVKELNLNFPDENLEKRFSTILTSRLKDIRSTSETIDLLTRAVKVGGVGLEATLAEKVVNRAANVAANFKDESSVRKIIEEHKNREAELMPKPPKVPVDTTPVLPPLPSKPSVASPGPAPAGLKIPPLAPLGTANNPQPSAVTAPPVVTAPVFSPPTMSSPASRRAVAEGRTTMNDIRGTTRLTGPVEELRQMSLTDYRRLGPDPISVIRKVYEKIQRLGKESFTKRSEGIKAWQESDVYRLYVDMGHESLLTGKSIRDLTLSHQQQGQPALTEEEFNFISDLNKKLRF